MLQRLGIFLVGTVIGGVAVGWYFIHVDIPGHWEEREAFIIPAGEVLENVAVLERLREGNTTSAINLLEQRVDSGLIGLFLYSSNRVPSAQHDLIEGALAQAWDYRSRHPRTNENPEVAAAIEKTLGKED